MEAIIDYRGKTPKKTTSGIPLITAKIIKGGAIQPVTEFIAEKDYESWMCRGIPKPGDIVMTTEAPLGEVAQLDDRKVALAQRIITLRGKSGLLDNTFLKYLLSSHRIQSQLDGRATGTTVKGIKQSELRQVVLDFPPFEEQKVIAHILGSLDDKIELNRQMNATLEAMAQALFKSWFVDFDPVIDNAIAAGNPIPKPLQKRASDRQALGNKRKPLPPEIQKQFPNRFIFNDDLGWIPEGWEMKQAQEIATISIGKTPPRKETQWFSTESKNNIIWVSIRDMGTVSTVIGDSSEYLTPEAVNQFNIKVVPAGSVILSFKLTLGRVAITQSDMTTNEAIAHFIKPQYGLTKEYIYSYLCNFDFQKLGSTSSIATAVNSKLIKSIPFLVPTSGVSQAFQELSTYWFENISNLSNQNITLSKTRDTLLPKLLSGKIRIPEAMEQMQKTL